MSKGLKKKSHWTSRVHEIVIVRNPEGQLGFELKGGAENGQFPYLGEVKPGKVAYEGGSKLVPEELLLEVNETPVAGLTIRDVLAVIKHCKDPIRLKCVKQGKVGTDPLLRHATDAVYMCVSGLFKLCRVGPSASARLQGGFCYPSSVSGIGAVNCAGKRVCRCSLDIDDTVAGIAKLRDSARH
uniref:PDZ domain-containing protein n=1 Tax=Strigops habroptila TaxID=2489341 RepID=A0A672TWC9_STRHB